MRLLFFEKDIVSFYHSVCEAHEKLVKTIAAAPLCGKVHNTVINARSADAVDVTYKNAKLRNSPTARTKIDTAQMPPSSRNKIPAIPTQMKYAKCTNVVVLHLSRRYRHSADFISTACA